MSEIRQKKPNILLHLQQATIRLGMIAGGLVRRLRLGLRILFLPDCRGLLLEALFRSKKQILCK